MLTDAEGPTEPIFDMFNVTNANTVTEVNGVYGTNGANWNQAQGILPGRLLKFAVQLDF